MCLNVDKKLTANFKKRKKIVAYKKLKMVDGKFLAPVQGTVYSPGIAVKALEKHNPIWDSVYRAGVHAYHSIEYLGTIGDDRVCVEFTTTSNNIVAVGENDIAFKQIRLTKADLQKAVLKKLAQLADQASAGIRSKYDINFVPAITALLKLNGE